jgi:hypothetical protein
VVAFVLLGFLRLVVIHYQFFVDVRHVEVVTHFLLVLSTLVSDHFHSMVLLFVVLVVRIFALCLVDLFCALEVANAQAPQR